MSREEANRIVRAAHRVRHASGMLKVALPTAAVLGAGAAIATGAIPGGPDGTTIVGCYANPPADVDGVRPNITVNDVSEAPGTLRVIDPSLSKPNEREDPARECVDEETEITWNQSGPQGPAGSQGPVGPQGPTGSQGPAGTPGSAGAPLIGGTSFGLTNDSGETFLKLKSAVQGTVNDKQAQGQIEIESFSLGAQSNIGSASGGGGAGKVTVQSFTITKQLDQSSPQLLQDEVEHRAIPTADLTFEHKLHGSEQPYLKFEFSNVIVSSVTDGQSSGGAPTEQVTFAFQKLEETFIGQNGKGSASVGWNVVANAKL